MDDRIGPWLLEAVQEATGNLREALEATPPNHPDIATMFDILDNWLEEIKEKIIPLDHPRRASMTWVEAVKAMPPDYPNRTILLNGVCTWLRMKYGKKEALEDLEAVIFIFEEAVKSMPPHHPDRAMSLDHLGRLQGLRYGKAWAPEDLEAAISSFEEAIKETTPGDSNLAIRLHCLGIMLGQKYDRTKALDVLEEALRNLREAVQTTPSDHPQRLRFVDALANRLGNRFQRKGEIHDLEEATRYAQEAVKGTRSDHPDRRIFLSSLGKCLGMIYGRRRKDEDLDGAISNTEEALKATPHNHPDLAILHGNLGTLLGERYEGKGALEDLKKAISNCEEVVKGIPLDHPDRPLCLNTLGFMLRQRYESTGELEHLEEAVNNCEKALEATPPGHSQRAAFLRTLGSIVGRKYHKTRALHDLEESIRNLREAHEITSTDHPDRKEVLNDLGIMLGHTYRRKEAFEYLEEGIRVLQEATKLKPFDYKTRAASFRNLASLLLDRYDRTRVIEDLEEAIHIFQEDLKATPQDYPNRRASLYYSLGVTMGDRYKASSKVEDLEEAIRYSREAVKATPDDHPDQVSHSFSLGLLLWSQYQLTKLPKDFESAVASLKVAASMESAFPIPRIRAGRELGELYASNGRWFEGSKALESAVNLLPTVSPSSLSRDDQQYVLSEFSGISSSAASLALQTDRPVSDALTILEAGRCIIAGFAINSRSDVSDLKASHPTICKEYEKCREEVTRYRTREKFNTNEEYRRRAASLKKSLRNLTAVETQIHQIPGFEQFQLPPEPTDLMRLAESGPIVAFNVSTIRSDAIIVTSKRIWAIKLLGLSYDTLVAKAKSIAIAGRSSRRNAKVRVNNSGKHSPKEQVHKDLLWLWTVAVRPVLNELGLLQLQRELSLQQLQRVWWVNGGVMGLVPIHAAGDHSEGSLDNTFSCVVSSYTSTFKSLRYAQEKVKDETSEYRMLLVDMPETPEHEVLNTEHEVNVIKNEFGELITLLKHPTKAEVMDKLEGCSFAHFACHGTSNPQDPAEGGLLLLEEGKPTLLSVRELDTVNLQHAELAYLSACSTAELPTGKLVDEAIHLSNSFQMIGFRHVIGTMWGADDHAAGEVAGLFYKALLSKSKGDSGGELRVAQALHDAVVEFKSGPNIREDVLKWGPFIHVGV